MRCVGGRDNTAASPFAKDTIETALIRTLLLIGYIYIVLYYILLYNIIVVIRYIDKLCYTVLSQSRLNVARSQSTAFIKIA